MKSTGGKQACSFFSVSLIFSLFFSFFFRLSPMKSAGGKPAQKRRAGLVRVNSVVSLVRLKAASLHKRRRAVLRRLNFGLFHDLCFQRMSRQETTKQDEKKKLTVVNLNRCVRAHVHT